MPEGIKENPTGGKAGFLNYKIKKKEKDENMKNKTIKANLRKEVRR